jgi:hypothetical protein
VASEPSLVNRVVMLLNKHGEPCSFCSDQPIELYWVDPNAPPDDHVYLHSTVNVGPEFVDQAISGHSIGHYYDAEEGKLQPGLPPGVALGFVTRKRVKANRSFGSRFMERCTRLLFPIGVSSRAAHRS